MEPSKMPAFQPDEEVIQRIVRIIEDVFQLGPDPTNIVELSDSVEPTTDVVGTMDMESTVAGIQMVAIDATMAMESTVTIDQKSAVDPTADVSTTVAGDQTAAVDTMVSVDPNIDIDDMDIDKESTITVDQTAAVDPTTNVNTTVSGDQTAAVYTMVSVDPTMDSDDMEMDMESIVFVDQTMAVDATMDMESSVSVDQKAAVDSTAATDQTAYVNTTVDVVQSINVASNTSSEPTIPENFSASIEPNTILNLDRPQLTFKQELRLIIKRLFAIECNPLESYLMVIMKRSSIDKTIRLMSGWILNRQLEYYYDVIPYAVIDYLRMESLTLIGDVSPRVRDCNCSLIMKMSLKGIRNWPSICPAITEMLDSKEHNMYKGGLDILQLISSRFKLEEFPKKSTDNLIRKLITLIGSPNLNKRAMFVSIIKDLIVQKTPVLLDHITVLIENILVLDNEHIKNINDENNKTLLLKDICISITTLAQSRWLPIDNNTHNILRYMIDRTKDKDDKIVKEACKFWISISKEQPDIYRIIVFPYLYDIMSSLADKLICTQEDLISIRNGHASIDYPFFMGSDSIRMHCFLTIKSMAHGFKKDILPGLIQIINRKVSDTDLKIQEVAIVLLGSLVECRECREAIIPHLETVFNKLILLNNYIIPGESKIRDKLLWTLAAYRDCIVHQPQYMRPLMTVRCLLIQYLLRSEIKYPHQYPWLEGEAFWNLTTNVHLSKDAFRPYLTNVLTIMFRGIYKYQTPPFKDIKYDKHIERTMRNNSTNVITNYIETYKSDILPIIMPLIDECIAKDDTYSKESAIVVLGLIAKGGIGEMVTELPKYLAFMVDTLVDYNRILSVPSCITLGRFHDLIVNRSSHKKYLVPLMQYLLTTENQYISTDPYTLSCVLYTLQLLIHDKPNSKEIFAPYLARIVANMCKAIVYSENDINLLQGDGEVDKYNMDSPMIVCNQFKLFLEDDKVEKIPLFKCSSNLSNRERAAQILYDITTIYKCSILPIIMPIIEVALNTGGWKIMESGIYAFGIINSDKLMDNAFTDIEWLPYLNEFFNCLMYNLSNKIPIVRINTMVTLSRYSFNIMNRYHKTQFLPLMRMISARALDTNKNVRTTAWQVWNILRHEATDNEPVLKWYMDHIWNGLIYFVESYRRLQRGQIYV